MIYHSRLVHIYPQFNVEYPMLDTQIVYHFRVVWWLQLRFTASVDKEYGEDISTEPSTSYTAIAFVELEDGKSW